MKDNNRLQTLLLSPLAELSAIPYPDIRQKQLDTVLHILHSSGEVLENGWPLILNMIGSLEQDHSDILVRASFQCLQLVFTDFLPAMPYRCYPICVETAAKFGSQQAELNVSLAAIGLLWNLSDYFFQVSNFEKCNLRIYLIFDFFFRMSKSYKNKKKITRCFLKEFYLSQGLKIFHPLISYGCVCIAN